MKRHRAAIVRSAIVRRLRRACIRVPDFRLFVFDAESHINCLGTIAAIDYEINVGVAASTMGPTERCIEGASVVDILRHPQTGEDLSRRQTPNDQSLTKLMFGAADAVRVTPQFGGDSLYFCIGLRITGKAGRLNRT